ncbi:hypothetical protein B0H13DRAFT_2113151 [Mycena leptocephala]|nr:hypothetical protein B0H13DRAFT_2113151 [Mycena leptocephala]
MVVILMGPLLLLFVTGAVIGVVDQRNGGLMRALDRDTRDYFPLPIPLIRVRNESTTRVLRRDSEESTTYHKEVAPGPRSLPTLWENEHQIFAEKRQDYEESWRLLSL